MGRVCQEMASCMSRAKHLPLVRTNTARGCTADKGCRLVWKFMRELVGILVTSMSIFGLQALAVSQRKMFARGRDDYSAITTILHAIYPWPPLLWRLRGVCVEGYGWIKAPGRGGCGIWCRYFRTVPEDKETTRHWGLRRWLGECCCPSSPWCLRPRTMRPLCLRSATRRRRANRHLPSRHRMVRRPRRVRAAAAAAAAPNGR